MATSKSRKTAGAKKPRRPHCRICDKTIPVPKGWTQGPAIRKHYWANHREVMSGRAQKGSNVAGASKSRRSATNPSTTTRRRARKDRSSTRKKGRS